MEFQPGCLLAKAVLLSATASGTGELLSVYQYITLRIILLYEMGRYFGNFRSMADCRLRKRNTRSLLFS